MQLYLAGPDVFRPDALAWAEQSRALVTARGHQPLLPLDNEASSADAIYRANLALIAQCDAVLANGNPFRGHEPDSGTAFEIGYAVALGKRVIIYLDDVRPQLDKLAALPGGARQAPDGRLVDRQGLTIENFALPLNLMLAIPADIVHGGLAAALDHLGPA